MKFPSGFKKILNNKFVLYLVYFITAMNIFGYVNLNDFNSVALFTLVAYITSFFNKNYVVILLVAILVTNVLGNTQFMIIEGMEGLKNKKKKKKRELVEGMGDMEEEEEEEEMDDLDMDSEPTFNAGEDSVSEAYGGKGKNPRRSLEKQYENLDSIIGADGIQAMTKDTKRLIQRQGKLAESMKAMGPLLSNAKELLTGFDESQLKGIQDTLKSLKQKK